MPEYYHDYLQTRTMGMNENLRRGRDLTAGLTTNARRGNKNHSLSDVLSLS